MSDSWVLKFPQVNSPSRPILLHVTRKQGRDLDLDILATDGDTAYRGKIRERSLSKLKASNYDGTDEQWSSILKHGLVSKQKVINEELEQQDVEIECTTGGEGANAYLSVTFRTRIEDITHRLGAIELVYSEDTDDIDLFGWACQAIDQRNGLEKRLDTGGKEASSAQRTIASLEKQLDELVTAKKEHEDQLLSKFKVLLDEKKLKIRNQQRILETAKVDAKKLEQMQLAVEKDPTRQSSNKRGRGEKTSNVNNDDDDDDSEGFEQMDIDNDRKDGNTDATDSEADQSEAANTETASEEDEDLDVPVRSVSSRKEPDSPPPPRTLPFQKRATQATEHQRTMAALQEVPEDDMETESEEDEL